MIIWRWTGYNALIYLAAMQAVPKDLYAAASLDGATSFQQLRKITVPAIRPTIIFTVIISTIVGMQVLAEPLLFGGGSVTGGSDRQFQTLSLYLYEVGFTRWEFGYASAAAWVMFVIILIAAVINYLLISRLRRSLMTATIPRRPHAPAHPQPPRRRGPAPCCAAAATAGRAG